MAITRIRSLLLGLCLCLTGTPTLAEDNPPELYGRSRATPALLERVELTDEDRRWLWERRVLRLGVTQPDYPPFDILGTGHQYEGMSADYASLIGELLNLKVEVRRYGSRQAAIEGLWRGEVDLLPTSNGFEAAESNLILSMPYVQDQPILASRVDDPGALEPLRTDTRLAMLEHYQPAEVVAQLYPHARPVNYPSTLSALAAVSFGQADLFLGNALAAANQISRSQFSNLQLVYAPISQSNTFAFASNIHNNRLMTLVNVALMAVQARERTEILHRWSSGSGVINPRPALDLTDSEQRWLQQHPRIRVVMNKHFMPFSFRDEQGNFRGLSADVLGKISQRIGVRFEVIDVDSIAGMIQKVLGGEADLLAALPPSRGREEHLSFTRSYLTSSMVMVAPDSDNAPVSLDEMSGKPLAIAKGSEQIAYLRTHYPQVPLVEAKGADDVLRQVAQGNAKAGVMALITSRYLIARHHRGELRVTAAVPLESPNYAFATARGSQELQSILNKALLSLTPQELDELTHRWRSEVIVADSSWRRYAGWVAGAGAVLVLLWVLALAWIRSLRRQVRRRRQAEKELLDQWAFMQAMISGTPYPIYVRDREGRLTMCNDAYLKALDITREATLGLLITATHVVPPHEAQRYQEGYLALMEDGGAVFEDREVVLEAGRAMTISHWMLPYRGGDGETVGMIAGWTDITDRIRLCTAYQAAKEEAEAASEAKTTFLATMSHEIRTPMNAVLGMLELASRKADAGVLDKLALDVASGAARSLLELIGDILDITRIESGHLQLAPQRCEVGQQVEAVVRLFDGPARAKNLPLRLQLEGDARVEVQMDPMRFRQIVSNLVSNAIKFTERGQVNVQVRCERDGDCLQVQVQVQDTGVGIPEADQAVLGAAFHQASNNPDAARQGTGLGLSISHRLCELMGAQLSLHSTLGQGTCAVLSLTLPCLSSVVGAPLPLMGERSDGHSALSILVVDDYPANRVLLDQQLGYLGHRVILASDGEQGLARWHEEVFDVVITDCNMPGLDGYRLARAIRAQEALAQRVPCRLLGFTANAQAEERERCLAAGMDDCLFKPLGLQDLAHHLSTVTAQGARPLTAQLMDLSALEQLTGGDVVSVRELLSNLLRCSRDDLQRLVSQREQPDLIALSQLVHRIKGGARLIKAQPLLAACETLERLCAGQGAAQDLALAIAALESSLAPLMEGLQAYCGESV
ncbi:MAG: transporter substrate-binding domain-containing protein [Pseudomonas sp.]|nr:transporter substrate-binding domain-containing protein [Pseudomonas sp.]